MENTDRVQTKSCLIRGFLLGNITKAFRLLDLQAGHVGHATFRIKTCGNIGAIVIFFCVSKIRWFARRGHFGVL